MKIAILTLPLHHNYGGILQAWALQTKLQEMGHTVEILMPKKRNSHSIWKYPIIWSYRLLRKLITKSDIPVFAEKRSREQYNNLYGNINKFIATHFKFKIVNRPGEIRKYKFDTIIVGSDQIWRKKYIKALWNPKLISEAFLSKIDDSKVTKIAYAASLGVDIWEYSTDETSEIAASLSKFKSISVRENSAIDLIYNNTGCLSQYVTDPTMLIDAKEYRKIYQNKYDNDKYELVTYILDHNTKTDELIKKVSQEKKLKVHSLNNINENIRQYSVEKWIEAIDNAKIVITDSFHGCVFCLILRKPFLFLCNPDRGNARFQSLIEKFKIGKHKINCISNYNKETDYNISDETIQLIEKYRKSSLEFLNNSILQ